MHRIDLVTVVNDVVNEAMIGYPDMSYRLIGGDCSAMVEGDADRLAQVVTNLLSNARTHGLHTESIDIVLTRDAQYAIFSISNVADVLDTLTVRSLFMPFKTASLHNPRNRGGMGLGLYITERIVTEHGGKIVYSHAEGRVMFTVSLPLSAA
jgi:chemotaxis family two-component system sensor kinase Cph1